MLKAVIFDMDGLMAETEPIHSKAYEAVVIEYGKQPIYEENGLIHQMAMDFDTTWNHLKTKHGIEADNKDMGAKKQRLLWEMLEAEDLQPMPGLIDLIKMLDKHKIKRAIGSASNRRSIDIITTALELNFEVIVSGYDVKKGKPEPDIFLEAARLLGVKPAECLVLEDSSPGVIAGHAAGMKVIAVPTPHTAKHDFAKADLIVPSLEKLDLPTIQGLFTDD